MSDFTLYRPISTQKMTAGAAAASATAAPSGTVGVYVYCDDVAHIDFTGAAATANAMPFPAGAQHYVGANEGQVLSCIRGGSGDANVWLTWVRKPV